MPQLQRAVSSPPPARPAIDAGVDPTAVVESINEAQAQREAARAELDGAPAPNTLDVAEVYAMIDSVGDVGTFLTVPARLGWRSCTRHCDWRWSTTPRPERWM
ncbi:MAG: hypothetical protein GEU98_25500 [Pseudonocardiaceae bacterium]|nr:hypothetical protein [Pseudonocardiaceae bacterium]